MAQKTVTVPKIACEHCVATIERALRDLEGVQSFDVDQSAKRVTVEWTEPDLSWDRIQTHLADVGYPPEGV
jgi:copper chaperone CopZ